MADERRGGAAGLPVRLGDASRCMRGDSASPAPAQPRPQAPARRIRPQRHRSLGQVSTFVKNVQVWQAQGNLRMSAVSEPTDGWTHPSVVGSRREWVIGAGAEADLDAAPADVDGGGGPTSLWKRVS